MRGARVEHPYTAIRREACFAVPFADFTRAFESLLGRMDPETLPELVRDAPDRARAKLVAVLGLSGFALFQKVEHGVILRALAGRSSAATMYVLGNALLAYEMARHEPDAALYVSPRVLVVELDRSSVRITYDLPSAALAQFESDAVDAAAATVDLRLAKLVDVAAALAIRTRARRGAGGLRLDESGRR
jgi:uncharacterized protein (DUF302 family)